MIAECKGRRPVSDATASYIEIEVSYIEPRFMTILTHDANADRSFLDVGTESEGPSVYVSDFLDSLLGAASERALVRRITNRAIENLPGEIGDLAEYYGGKCMGYPAVWLIRHALKIEEDVLAEQAEACKASIFLSLTTSIVDDWLDKDTEVSIAPVSLMYMLMVGGISGSHAATFPSEESLKKLREITEHLLLVEKCAVLSHQKKYRLSSSIAKVSGMKIGHFHELIAREFCKTAPISDQKAQALWDLSNKFGCWCAFLDDLIDVRSDYILGNWVSVPVLNLVDRLKIEFGENVSPISHSARLSALARDCQTQMIEQTREKLEEIGVEADRKGFPDLGQQLQSAQEKLPAQLERFLANTMQPAY